MMPSAQQQQQFTTIKQVLKPKIGFSIDSIIVGSVENFSKNDFEDGKEREQSSNKVNKVNKFNKNNNNNNDSVDNKNISECKEKKSRSPSPVISKENQNHQQPMLVPGISASFFRRSNGPPSSHHSHLPLHPSDLSAHPQFLAQFQAAAALANVHAVQQHLPPHFHNPNIPRESYQLLNPWLLSRHGRMFPHRFPGSE
jgi:hypothetical protein